MNKYIKYAFALALPTVALSSCDDYLDTMPDNRATIDTEDKIKSLLVSAYPTHEFSLVCELSSDNCDDIDPNSPYSERFFEDAFAWKDEMETGQNESLSRYWEDSYNCIASANEALEGIKRLGGPVTTSLQGLYSEALLCRAYNHFMLAQLFCMPWTQNAAQELGLPYMEHSETELRPEYERGNLADFYEKIEADLTEGLKYVTDSHLDVPKYHFNQKAAYAFATKFYLAVEKWQDAADWATKCLGSSPRSVLRDNDAQAALPVDGNGVYGEPQALEYIKLTHQCNLMMTTATSRIGWVFGRSFTGGRINHNNHIASTETFLALKNKFGSFKRIYGKYIGSSDMALLRKVVCLFEYTDIVAQTGFVHSVIPVFTTDEALLNRAEAYIMLNRYDEAAADLTLWAQNYYSGCPVLTPTDITEYFNSLEYSYSAESPIKGTLKKHLNPAFSIGAEGSTQEAMLQCMLAFHRVETLHFGFRWFDIKRYGIEIPRRTLNAGGLPSVQTDFLAKDDKRRAFQIPLDVRDAGLEANPR
ncbi:RagB/SusD family nutrient uptake outer membrane protein [Duncaniella muris]|uniref:RagB/SusD family nutrient uptake outer membrane protein n=1 Tax=Duncaniella muris TaxID=2094150 RepID=UPI0026DF48FE|nr:RagB/SusD family nutrient uptake outer membrane protein [Duncaniella muris]